MKNFFIVFLLTCTFSVNAQYYYNDIIGTRETNRQMRTYLTNKVNTVTASGSDQRGMKATDFSELHEVKENGKALRASSIINLNKTVIYSRFDDQGRVTSMSDSSSEVQSVTTYRYDASGNLAVVENSTKDPVSGINQVEVHQWYYKPDGKPQRMWRIIRNGENASIDSLEVRFVIDEEGNTTEERMYKRGYETGYLYYYYDDKNRLSDIVRYNTKSRKLLPDVMFEYDDQDRVIQKITTLASHNMGSYLIWRYIYDEKGLKSKEALFNQDKQLTGKIDYVYTFLR